MVAGRARMAVGGSAVVLAPPAADVAPRLSAPSGRASPYHKTLGINYYNIFGVKCFKIFWYETFLKTMNIVMKPLASLLLAAGRLRVLTIAEHLFNNNTTVLQLLLSSVLYQERQV